MRGLAIDPELIALRLRQRRERIRLVRSLLGIRPGDGVHVRYLETVAFRDDDEIKFVYEVLREIEEGSVVEAGLPRLILVGMDDNAVREASEEDVKAFLAGEAYRCYLD